MGIFSIFSKKEKKEVLDAFLQTGHDMKYVGTPYYVETYMHRDWDTLTKKGV